jgi:hypothetical protein
MELSGIDMRMTSSARLIAMKRFIFSVVATCGLAVSSFAGEPAIDPPMEWPFVALPDLTPPEVQHADRITNGIDNFILARLEEKSLSLAPQASPRTLVTEGVLRFDRPAADARGSGRLCE